MTSQEQETMPEQQNTFTTQQLQLAYDVVFRCSTDQPGFYYQDLGGDLDSHDFRRVMVELMKGLMALSELHSDVGLDIRWIGRFNHQHTSRFHRDNADAHSFLMLGYEPTKVDSRVSVADYSKWIETQAISTMTYFGSNTEVNTARDEDELEPFVTEFSPFSNDHYHLLLLNNSKAFDGNPLGVFHRGVVAEPDTDHDRVINSIMLYAGGDKRSSVPDTQVIDEFVTTDKVNR